MEPPKIPFTLDLAQLEIDKRAPLTRYLSQLSPNDQQKVNILWEQLRLLASNMETPAPVVVGALEALAESIDIAVTRLAAAGIAPIVNKSELETGNNTVH